MKNTLKPPENSFILFLYEPCVFHCVSVFPSSADLWDTLLTPTTDANITGVLEAPLVSSFSTQLFLSVDMQPSLSSIYQVRCHNSDIYA